MRSLGFFLCYLSFTVALQATIDSLRQQLAQNNLNDTARITLLIDLAFYNSSTDPNAGIRYAEEAIRLAQETQQDIRLAKAYSYKALNLHQSGQDSLAIIWFKKAIQTARQRKQVINEASAQHNLALLYTDRGEYGKALAIRQQVNLLLEKAGDQQRLSNALNSTGAIHLHLANYPEALHFFQKSHQMALEGNEQYISQLALENIGLVHKKMGNYAKALHYYNQALAGYMNGQNALSKSNLLANIASLYDEQGNQTKALNLFKEALLINQEAGYPRGEARCLTGIATVYAGMKHYPEAFLFFRKADSLFVHSPDPNAMSALYTSWAEAIEAAPDSTLQHGGYGAANRLSITLSLAQKALSYAQSSELKEREMHLMYFISKVHEQLQEHPEALKSLHRYASLKDTLLGEDRKIAIVKKELQFEADRKELQNQLMLQRERTQQKLIIICATFLLLLGVIAFIIYKKRQNYRQRQQELLLQTKISDTEMKVLRLQMNPHFIFNCLNSISHYILKQDYKQADYYLTKFAKLMRTTLEYSQEKLIPLEDELDLLTHYIKLEQMRMNNTFAYSITVDPAIDIENTSVPPLILQPFVENSIWHGFSDGTSLGHLNITILQQNQHLLCTIEDNGKGRKVRRAQKRKSYGIQLTRERLQLLSNENGSHTADISINDLTPGTRVTVKLPIV
ncbi:tetratricopeptide repeat protein [Olivibacter sp. SDN3]|uniref:tetratricopeptide repeat protein n=1 Tax=Olivibacter sp. SDN3 TaxID=2764720 RepID=UPI001650F2E4|nr:tetratricopeptide repeat protein [Olivibacter sp. SDN3]QNL51745.1 tetratricopeptide repeat protein [Olivibacter sp. SDN3]